MKYNIIKGESKHIDALANLWLELMKVHSEIDKNYFSSSANNLHQYKNMLEEEIGDLLAMVELLTDLNIGVTTAGIQQAKRNKFDKLKRWSNLTINK